jgi:hypothetical protein
VLAALLGLGLQLARLRASASALVVSLPPCPLVARSLEERRVGRFFAALAHLRRDRGERVLVHRRGRAWRSRPCASCRRRRRAPSRRRRAWPSPWPSPFPSRTPSPSRRRRLRPRPSRARFSAIASASNFAALACSADFFGGHVDSPSGNGCPRLMATAEVCESQPVGVNEISRMVLLRKTLIGPVNCAAVHFDGRAGLHFLDERGSMCTLICQGKPSSEVAATCLPSSVWTRACRHVDLGADVDLLGEADDLVAIVAHQHGQLLRGLGGREVEDDAVPVPVALDHVARVGDARELALRAVGRRARTARACPASRKAVGLGGGLRRDRSETPQRVRLRGARGQGSFEPCRAVFRSRSPAESLKRFRPLASSRGDEGRAAPLPSARWGRSRGRTAAASCRRARP